MAPPDEQQRLIGRIAVEGGKDSPSVLYERYWSKFDPPIRSLEPSREAGLERAEIEPVFRLLECGQTKSLAKGDRSRAPWTPSQSQVEDAPRADLRVQPAFETCDRRTVFQPPVEPGQDLPVMTSIGHRIEERRRVPRYISDRQQIEHQVIVVVLEGRRRWQDDVGVTGGFVEVEIDRRHEIEALESSLELYAVRGRKDRVAGYREQGPNLPLSLCEDLLRQGRNRQLATVCGKASHPAGVPPEMAGAGICDQVNGRLREHGTTDAVEVAGNDVQYVHQPLAEPAIRLCRHPEPSIADGGRGGGKCSSEVTDRLGLDARHRRNPLRRDARPPPRAPPRSSRRILPSTPVFRDLPEI